MWFQMINISNIFIKLSTVELKTPERDGIPLALINLCKFILARPLDILLNKSLSTGIELKAIQFNGTGHFSDSW